MLKAAVLGMVQGLTEFLPVSSTAHLVLLRWFTGWKNGVLESLAFDVALHAGTLLSLFICFRKDIKEMLGKNHRLLMLILLGTIPAGVAGILLEDIVEGTLRSPVIIAFALVAIGAVMLIAERFQKTREMKDITIADALLIGLAQAVALVPGVSRSGITISAALFLGLRREASARFAFLLSMPVIGGAALLEAGRLLREPSGFDLPLFAMGFITSMIAGVLAIRFLMSYLRRHPLNAFVYYRFGLAAVITGWFYTK